MLDTRMADAIAEKFYGVGIPLGSYITGHEMAGQPDTREERMREAVHAEVQRQTENIRDDIGNIERLYANISEKQNESQYEIRRFKEILDDMKTHVEGIDTGIKKMVESLADLRLIRSLVYGSAGMVLTAFMLYLLAKGAGFPHG